jgi:hypothetical protein
MDARQAAASAVPDDSVDHVVNALVNLQVTDPAADTVSASIPVDLADSRVTQAARFLEPPTTTLAVQERPPQRLILRI